MATHSNITFTAAGQTYLAELLAKQNVQGMGIRVFIIEPGSPQAETCIAYCKPDEHQPDDLTLELEAFTVWIEASSVPFLEDAYVDYSKEEMGGQLTIRAPNAKVSKIADDSPLDAKVQYFLTTEINPTLASHNGMVQLVEIIDEVAILRFGGGCQGCGMVDVTLKDGIEKRLIEKIPELKGVRDVTDHSQREHAYYR